MQAREHTFTLTGGNDKIADADSNRVLLHIHNNSVANYIEIRRSPDTPIIYRLPASSATTSSAVTFELPFPVSDAWYVIGTAAQTVTIMEVIL